MIIGTFHHNIKFGYKKMNINRWKQIEILGATIILLASIWQIFATSWWETQATEWQYIIDREYHLTILSGLMELANLSTEQNHSRKEKIRSTLVENTNKAIIKSDREFLKRKNIINNGQYATFHNIKDILYLLGSILVLLSQFYTQIINKQKN